MSTDTELKLLTLLNVTAIKRPLEVDKPGGYRASPTLSRKSLPLSHNGNGKGNGHDPSSASSSNPDLNGKVNGEAANGDEKVVKRRRSVNFGGILGPSGSTFNSSKKRKVEGEVKEPVKNGDSSLTKGIKKANKEAIKPFIGLEELAMGSGDEEEVDEYQQAESLNSPKDTWNLHFAPDTNLIQLDSIKAANSHDWNTTKLNLDGYGRIIEQNPASSSSTSATSDKDTNRVRPLAPPFPNLPERPLLISQIIPSLLDSIKSIQTDSQFGTTLRHLGSYRDFYLHSMDGEVDGSEKVLYGSEKERIRKATVVHSLNHVLKTRRRIIKNNEKLAHQASTSPSTMPDPPRDQSFTRPSILWLLPLRSLAYHYLTTHLFPLLPTGSQIENQKPFSTHFGGGSPDEDPLAAEEPGKSNFPIDHLVNFRGNSDDNFRFGIKVTRKAWRIIMPPASEEKLMECDILISSPLGIKMASDREDSTDLLSSIEVCLVDGADIMGMQNWDHVKFIFDHLNEIPKNPHGCDFGRVKPWYLESQAKYLRQTVLLSRYDTPELRAIWNKHCLNLAGRIRVDPLPYNGVLTRIKSGVKQTFERVDMSLRAGEGAIEEVEKRLEYFLKKTIPMLQRSAISRTNTIIIVPSYFDFVRLNNAMRKMENVKFAAISEYSSNSEIGKARTMFFKSKVPFLIVTERFHFYRRYILRGARTIVWYQLPEHAQFYNEFLAMPFVTSRKQSTEDQDQVVDPEEIRCHALFSKYDGMRLERVVGTIDAKRMVASGESRFEFL